MALILEAEVQLHDMRMSEASHDINPRASHGKSKASGLHMLGASTGGERLILKSFSDLQELDGIGSTLIRDDKNDERWVPQAAGICS